MATATLSTRARTAAGWIEFFLRICISPLHSPGAKRTGSTWKIASFREVPWVDLFDLCSARADDVSTPPDQKCDCSRTTPRNPMAPAPTAVSIAVDIAKVHSHSNIIWPDKGEFFIFLSSNGRACFLVHLGKMAKTSENRFHGETIKIRADQSSTKTARSRRFSGPFLHTFGAVEEKSLGQLAQKERTLEVWRI